jgi:hypothetical protein
MWVAVDDHTSVDFVTLSDAHMRSAQSDYKAKGALGGASGYRNRSGFLGTDHFCRQRGQRNHQTRYSGRNENDRHVVQS